MRFFTIISCNYLKSHNIQNIIAQIKNTPDLLSGIHIAAYEIIGNDLYLYIATNLNKKKEAVYIREFIGLLKSIQVNEIRKGWPLMNQGVTIINHYLTEKIKLSDIGNGEFKQKPFVFVYYVVILFTVFAFSIFIFQSNNSFSFPIALLLFCAISLIWGLSQNIQLIHIEDECLKIKKFMGRSRLLRLTDIYAMSIHQMRTTEIVLLTKVGKISFHIFSLPLPVIDWPIFKTIGYRAGLVVLEYGSFRLKLGKPENLEFIKVA